MATTKIGALKITTPSNLPKNEKDLICMLLAGRLKDLWTGRLLCAELAINDLLKDATGVDALGELNKALSSLKDTLNDLKNKTGYNEILGKINSTLGQLSDVFSLGGLCPSPVHPPKIPDILGELNTNLFGQASNILTALTKVSNPKMCLGAGPDGISVSWESMSGDLKNLKNLINQFKSNPANYKYVMDSFVKNINGQVNRLKSDLKRLENNLTDPFGIQQKKLTANLLTSAKNKSDGYKVKNNKGIEFDNPTKLLTSADVDSVVGDISNNMPVVYKTVQVLDYCGDVVGVERVIVTGDPRYMGYSTDPDFVNTDTPTVNPTAQIEYYSYLFTEDETGNIIVYDTTGTLVTSLKLTRGKHYRIGFELYSDNKLQFLNGDKVWTHGMTYSKSPEFGIELDIEYVTADTYFQAGELDWEVLYEVDDTDTKTTPNELKASNGITIEIDGPTVIPLEDRVYDGNNMLNKAVLHNKTLENNDAGFTVKYDALDTDRVYTKNGDTLNYENTLIYPYKKAYTIEEITATEKSFNTVSTYDDNSVLISKLHIDTETGFDIKKFSFYIAPNIDASSSAIKFSWLVEFMNPISFYTDMKFPYTVESYNYNCIVKEFDGSTTVVKNQSDKLTVSLDSESGRIKIQFSTNSFSNVEQFQIYDFAYELIIAIPDISDRTFAKVGNDPYIQEINFGAKTKTTILQSALYKQEN